MDTHQPFVITISRELGSGGRTIGRKLAAQLNVRYSDKNLIVPEGVEASTYMVEDGKLLESWFYEAGEVIPAATGVVLKAELFHYLIQRNRVEALYDLQALTDRCIHRLLFQPLKEVALNPAHVDFFE